MTFYDALGTGGVLQNGDVFNSDLRGWGTPETSTSWRDSDTVWVTVRYSPQNLSFGFLVDVHGYYDYTIRNAEIRTDALVFGATGIDVRTSNLSYLLTRGHDRIYGNRYGDTLDAGDGHDVVYGRVGDDKVSGDDGRDTIYGGEGADSLSGNDHADQLFGESGNDNLNGMNGADSLVGGDGDDTLLGGQQGDTLHGEVGQDLIFGAEGDDRMAGHEGHDRLNGDAGNDMLFGGGGRDTLAGGNGRDVHFLGQDADSDVIVFNGIHDSRRGEGVDTLREFNRAHDVIDLSAIDARVQTMGSDDAFAFSRRGPAAHSVWVESYTGGVFLMADVDGNARADLRIRVAGVQTLTLDDLIL
ncbi:M10 family metallopeptidase C-terminal domain-containing protein [Gemmobacter sp.]|uniref:calcium-binding protein n=1 Tax=Gemmobacter sp. TaxID=1898957 RepID=UPI0025BF1B43|nr:M10 family metallopeptidase C-terminal domain-containing protein [Gemmobacter sp.]